jgi:hypothetical protein
VPVALNKTTLSNSAMSANPAGDDVGAATARRQMKITGHSMAVQQKVARGEDAISQNTARGMAEAWNQKAHNLDAVLGGFEWDRRGDFGLYKNDVVEKHVDVGEGSILADGVLPLNFAEAFHLRMKAVNPSPNYAIFHDDLHQHYLRTRDMRLRRWYIEALPQSPDPLVQSIAQVRLQLQLDLRTQRAEIAELRQQRDAFTAAKDATSARAPRLVAKQLEALVRTTMQLVKGKKVIDEKTAKNSRQDWNKRHHTLEEIMGGAEWDNRQDWCVYACTRVRTGALARRDADVEVEEQAVSDDDEEGGVLLTDVYE